MENRRQDKSTIRRDHQHVVAGVAKTAERNELRMQRLARAVADLRADAAALIKADAAASPEQKPRRRSFGF